MDNFVKPIIKKLQYPKILAHGHLGVQWQQHEGTIVLGENELGFTCICGGSGLGNNPILHKTFCERNINEDND